MKKGKVRSDKIKKFETVIYSWEEGLKNLGNCIAQFQIMEEVLSLSISAMIGRSKSIGRIVTSEMPFKAKIAVYRALFIYHYESSNLPKQIKELISRVYWAEQERNAIVHSIWDASEDQPGKIEREKTACSKNGLRKYKEHITPDDLDDLANLYEGIATDIIGLTEKYLPKIKIKIQI